MCIDVSIIIPAYNAHNTIIRAIKSLLSQSISTWQAIIIGDDATNYRDFLKDFITIDDRFVFADTACVGAGAAIARNIGISLAKGRLIAPLDADDLYLPNRLAALIPLALKFGAAFDNVEVVRDEDDVQISTLFPVKDDIVEIDCDTFFKTSVPMFPIVNKDMALRWDPGVRFCEDVVFNAKIFDKLPLVHFSSRCTYQYRQRLGSTTFSEDSGQRADTCYRYIAKRLAIDGFGMENVELVRKFANNIETKRRLNEEYIAAFDAGLCANFQEFIASR